MTTRIDITDARIIRLLQLDGRRPNTDIARLLGVTEGTVRKRIERLVRDKIIQFGAIPDPLKLGYQHYAMIELQVDLAKIEGIAKRLADLPELVFVGTCTGTFDIVATAVFRSIEHMHEFMTKSLARVPGIQRTSTSSFTHVVKREYVLPLNGSQDGPPDIDRPRAPKVDENVFPTGKRRRSPDGLRARTSKERGVHVDDSD